VSFARKVAETRTAVKVLFFLPHSREAASCRYRIHQFLPYLEENGVECTIRELVDSELYEFLYRPGHRARKIVRFGRRALARARDVRDVREHDVLFVHRECFPFGPPLIESLLTKMGKPLVYDFDDAIFLPPDQNRWRTFVRVPEKTNTIIRLADEVIVSNEHLRAFSTAYNQNVTVVPTSVDTTQFRARNYPNDPPPPSRENPIRIGWIGSHSTGDYIERSAEPIRRTSEQFPIELVVVGAGRKISIPGVRVLNQPWRLETEIEDFRRLDIGVYPLKGNVWDLGKAGFKTIQYMAVGVPAVASRLGVNCTLVRDGENGFLATSPDEWTEKLGRLCGNARLRHDIGLAGRKTVVEGYSLDATAPKLLDVLRRAAASRREPTHLSR
jgi:glycosyltransferase involved in cell wall biosynthesis